MPRTPAFLVAAGLFAAFLVGCGSEEGKDYGKEITSTADQPKVDVQAEIAKIESNPNMPAAAKEAAIANLRRGEEMANQQNAAKSVKK